MSNLLQRVEKKTKQKSERFYDKVKEKTEEALC